jgi:catechol 2,3-dioxygenase-like lactoylglutathione lyase family enzyme
MFDHITIRASDRGASDAFYDTVLRALGIGRSGRDERYTVWGGDFSIAAADAGTHVTRRLHIGFVAPSRVHVDAFWQAGIDAGYRSDGEPGLRPQYNADYYGAFLIDPDGNSVESCTGFRDSGESPIDHLWIGVHDIDESLRFWQAVAPVLGLGVSELHTDHFHIHTADRSSALVADGRPATENVHIAFPVPDDEAVAEFHRAATTAGYRDNGAPGERPEYHAGYVGAFVLDPDGNNVEAVNHNR